MPSLLPKVTNGESDIARKSALQAIGFVCENVDPNFLESQSNAILTAVAEGARKDQPR
jgi:importin subunit beta-1